MVLIITMYHNLISYRACNGLDGIKYHHDFSGDSVGEKRDSRSPDTPGGALDPRNVFLFPGGDLPKYEFTSIKEKPCLRHSILYPLSVFQRVGMDSFFVSHGHMNRYASTSQGEESCGTKG